MNGPRMLSHCSNTTAHTDTTLESSTSVPLSMESYVSLLREILPSNYQNYLEILSIFRSGIRGFIKVMNGFHLTTAIEKYPYKF